MKGVNKRGDGDDDIGRQRLMQEERRMTGKRRALTAPLPTDVTGQEDEDEKEENEDKEEKEREDEDEDDEEQDE